MILILFGAAISLPSAVKTKEHNGTAPVVELSPLAIDRMKSSLLEPGKVKAMIAEQTPKHAKKIQKLLALLETIDFGCEKTAAEDFVDPTAMSLECHRMKWFWEDIFYRLGFYSVKPKGWPRDGNF